MYIAHDGAHIHTVRTDICTYVHNLYPTVHIHNGTLCVCALDLRVASVSECGTSDSELHARVPAKEHAASYLLCGSNVHSPLLPFLLLCNLHQRQTLTKLQVCGKHIST